MNPTTPSNSRPPASTATPAPPFSPIPTRLAVAEVAALEAGRLLRASFGSEAEVDGVEAYDIKLALDRECQRLIEAAVLGAFANDGVIGEEGVAGTAGADYEWIVDPIDGTVNFFYGIPHFCVSIGLRHRGVIEAGVIHDPMMGETWKVVRGGLPTLNGRPIRVSQRCELSDSIVTVGFSKSKASLDHGFERYRAIAYMVRKSRLMGSAALALAYIACGRLDAYIEEQISLWDIAAGQLLVEAAGGKVITRPSTAAEDKLFICASNGRLPLEPYGG